MATIGVAFGGPSPEHDISILTGLQVARLLSDGGSDVVGLYWRKTGDWVAVAPSAEARDFLDPEPKGSRPIELVASGSDAGFVERKRLGKAAPLEVDVVVNCCHGGPGENGTLAALLTAAGIACTGPGHAAAVLAMDKHATNLMARSLGVPVADHVLLAAGDIPFPGPYIVKPRFGGSSIGIEVVADAEAAFDLESASAHLGDGAVVEPLLEGWVDVNVAVRTAPEFALSQIERPLRGDDAVYSYESKYLQGGSGIESAPRELPAVLPDAVAETIRQSARTMTVAFGLTGISRIDFLWDQGDRVFFNEVNSIPGGMSLYLWKGSGVDPRQVILDAADEARRDPAYRRWTSVGADGRALRSAGSIAAKLS
jgi:D-alanine-D-alanine ligase